MLEKRRFQVKFQNLFGKVFLSLVLVALIGVVSLPFVNQAHAQLNQSKKVVNTTAQSAGLANTATDLPTIIGRIIYVVLGTVGVIFLALMLFSGYQYMTAGGDPEKIKTAITRIRNAVIGLLIIAFSFVIVNFILGWLTGNQGIWGTTGGGGGGGGGFGQWGNTGGLGNAQIIEYHYPEPGQTNVPRNTAIVITFVPNIDPASFISGWTKGQPMSGKLNDGMVRIHPEGTNQNLSPDMALAAVSPDGRTVMIKPNDPLGNAQKPTWYEVVLDAGILNASGTKIFGGSFSTGYNWKFQVSTQIDNTPPQVLSVIPMAGGPYKRNIVIQVNFNEPMFPNGVAGFYKNGGFQNVQIYQSDGGKNEQQINGEFRLSNGYRTVEFVTDEECGVNSCRVKIYCLPADKTIRGIIKAATLLNNDSALAAGYKTGIFNGAVDMAFNSLDGDGDSKATGPVGDPAGGFDDFPSSKPGTPPFAFLTNSQINREPPFIKSVDPGVKAQKIPLDKNIDISWLSDPNDINGVLLAQTVNSRGFRIYAEGPQETDPNTWWFFSKMINIDDNGQEASSTSKHVQSVATIYHRPFINSDIPKQGQDLNNYYDPYVRHYVMNIYQNCFNPAAMVKNGNKMTSDPKPNFCNDSPVLGTDLGEGNFYCDFIKKP